MPELNDTHYQRMYDTYWMHPDVQIFQKSQTTNQIRWLFEDPSGFMEAAFGIPTAIVSEEYIKAANIAVAFTTLQHKSAMAETPHLNPFSPPRNPLIGYNESPISIDLAFVCNGEHETGKSIWLFLILIWRLQCGLPTGYASSSETWFFFNQEGVTKGPLYSVILLDYRRLSDRLGNNHWFLVDTTEGCYERDMPMKLAWTGFYLVQVTSQTKMGWTRWMYKSKPEVFIHTMKSFHANMRGAPAQNQK
ncbi:uncharacterized protein EV420DRAFT_9479 [Desarmillaria tabescens]|uniref:Uncharacterized protein n=1 Tax=Armillaria tabescens TaxID=1929756 RepID=A0AA39U210_ARMTA|nr:uncharacterized protein EV420DRAFT_9479 [Desarmillaria tabescens]KAK0469124.1 hypothetical protein EV420DRAFT_9479 [Desarmillaria tabescens]